MEHRWRVGVAAAIVLAMTLGGCKDRGQRDLLPVGTCVRVSDAGTATVSCAEPHTHRVIAIAGEAEACPRDTDMYAQPADPDDGLMTTCFQADAGAE